MTQSQTIGSTRCMRELPFPLNTNPETNLFNR
jgi:hypothetical protein